MHTKTEIMKFLLDHLINYDEDITVTDFWIICGMIIDFLNFEPDRDKQYRVMNNIKNLIKGVIATDS